MERKALSLAGEIRSFAAALVFFRAERDSLGAAFDEKGSVDDDVGAAAEDADVDLQSCFCSLSCTAPKA